MRAVNLEPIAQNYKDSDGTVKTRIISIEIQKQSLGSGWKPVDVVDESKLQCEDGYTIMLIPFDAGDHISYEYKKIFDTQKYKKEINDLKQQLSDSDYKIAKCYEANLLGKDLPYDMVALHAEREAQRSQINELEAKL